MVTNLQTYTERLEEPDAGNQRAHHQTRTFCGIVQEIGALSTLKEIGRCLINRFRPIVECRQMALLVLNDARDGIYIVTESQALDLREPEPVQSICTALEELGRRVLSPVTRLIVPLLMRCFTRRCIHCPFFQKTSIRCSAVACSGDAAATRKKPAW
jgi:two-component system response regulator HydG